MITKNDYFNSLSLNGIMRSQQDLLQYAHSQLLGDNIQQWESSLFSFIIEWLNDSLLIIAKTSGSTGNPKPVEISKDMMIRSALATGEALKLQEGNTSLLCLSADYIAGKMMIVRAFVLKLDLCLISPSLDGIENIDFTIDFAAMLPLQVKKCFSNKFDLSLINKLIIGGAAVDSELEKQILELQNISVYSSFGMTETLSHIALKEISAGENYFTALPGVIFTTDKNSCLCINVPYLNIQFLQTNDVVKLIDSSRFEWVGRLDNVVNSGGVKLFPEQIEAILHDDISMPFFITGLVHPIFGEALVLIIESDSEADEVFIHEIIKAKLTKFQRPKKIFFVPEFMYTNSSKLQRTKTVELYNIKF